MEVLSHYLEEQEHQESYMWGEGRREGRGGEERGEGEEEEGMRGEKGRKRKGEGRRGGRGEESSRVE